MQAATNDELPQERALFISCWRVIQNYRRIDKKDANAWGELYSRLSNMCSAFEKDNPALGQLAAGIAAALYTYLEYAPPLTDKNPFAD